MVPALVDVPKQIRQPVNRRVVVVGGGSATQFNVPLAGGFKRFQNGRTRSPSTETLGTLGTLGTVGGLGGLVTKKQRSFEGH